MINLANSRSLSDFQRTARSCINGLNETKEPLLLTVNGKVQAVLMDPSTFQELQEQLEKERFIAAVEEGLRDVDAGRTHSLEEVMAEIRAKHGF